MKGPTRLPDALAEIEELRGQVRDLLQLLGQEAMLRDAEGGASPVKTTDAYEFSEGLVPKQAGKDAAQYLLNLHQMIETLPDIIFTLDLQGNLVGWNKRLQLVTGFTPQELNGRPAMSFVPEHEHAQTAAAIQRAFEDGYAELESHLLTKDGRTIPYHWTGARLHDPQGRMIGLTGVGRDITERKVAEQALRSSEERLRQALLASNTGLWDWNTETNEVRFSREWKRQLGYEEEELPDTYETWETRLHPDDRARVIAYVKAYVAHADGEYQQEFRLRHREGNYRWIAARASFVTELDGRQVRLLGSHVDITTRKEAEAALHAVEARQHVLLNSTPAMIYSCKVTDDFGATFVSENVRLLGYRPQDFTDDPHFWVNHIHPDDRARVRAELATIFETGQHVHEYRFLRKDGTYCWLHDELRVSRNEAGVPQELIGYQIDITDRKKAEEALQKSDALFRALIENSSDIITVLELDGTIRFESPSLERLLGYAQHELDGLIAFDFIHPDDLPTVLEKFQLVVQRPGEAQTAEFRFRHKDGSWLVLEGIGRAIFNTEGRRCVIVNSRDVTERKRVENALAQRSLQQQVIAEFGEFALRERAVQSVMDQAVQRIAQTLHTEYCKVLELQPGGTSLLLRAGVGWHDGLVGRATVNADSESQAGYTLNSNEPVIVENLEADRRFNGPPLLFDHGVVSGLSVIIRREHQPWGVLGIHTSSRRSFTKDDVNFVQSMANILGTIIERNSAEEAAHRNHVLLSAIMDASIDHISVKDLDGRYIHMNRTGANALGMPVDEIIGWDDVALWGNESGASLRAGDRRVVESGETITVEESLMREGKATVYLTTKAPYRDPEGRIIGVIRVARDITERKQAEETLRQSETRFRSLFENSPVAYQSLDREGRFIDVNHRLCRLLGYEKEELIGRDFRDLWAPNVQAEFSATFEAFKKSGKVRNELDLRRRDGTIVNAVIDGRIQRDQNGEFIRAHCILTDITERKQAEDAVRQSEARLKEAQRLAHLGSWELDLTTNRLTWSDEIYRIFEINRHSFGASYDAFLSAVHPDDRAAVDRAYTQSVRLQTPYEITHRLLLPDERVKYVQERCETFYDATGAPLRSVGTVQDVTERIRLSQQEVARNEQLRRLSELGLTLSGDPMEIFERVVRMIGELFKVQVVCLSEIVGPELHFTAVYVNGEVRRDAGRCQLTITPCATVERDKELRVFDHVSERFPQAAFLQDHEAVSYCGFPALDRQGRVVAVTCLLDDQPHEFTAEEQALLRMFGQRIAMELERARYLADQARHAEERERAHTFIRQIIDTDPNFIFAKDRDGRFTLINKAVADAYGTTVDNLIGKTDAEFNPNRDEVDFFRLKDLEVMDSLQERFISEEKITDAAGNVRWLQTVKRPILDQTGRAVMILGASTDITERKRIEEMLRQRERDLQQAIEERQRISEDLHDGILQSIYAIGLGLEACKPLVVDLPNKSALKLNAVLQRTIGQLNHVLEEVRNFIAGLESQILDGQDFEAVLQTMVHTLAAHYPVPYRIAIEPAAAQRLSTEQAYHVMNIAREALSNSFRHSGATRITLSLKRLRRSVRLSVTDNGVGFNPVGARDVGHGLANMAARAQKIGGKLTLQSKPRQGAKVLVDIPRRLTDADT